MKNKKGMSLVELLITISIFTIGIAGFSLLMLNSWRLNSFVLESGQATNEANRAIDIISKDLRKARPGDNGEYPIKQGENFDLTFYANVDDDPEVERIHYFLDNSENLKRGVTQPLATIPVTYPSGDDSVQTIARYIVNKTSSEPIFFYYDKNYPDSSALTTPITLTEARLIRIHLWVNIKPITAPENVNLESFVEVRNLNENLY
jgi:prepilin-type N-terminal cleavage/methylation domain-containing protein